jgi:predicted metal-dependent hydrolase
MPDDLVLSADDAVLLAQQLIDEGRPFHAHEVFVAVWKAAPQDERDLWKGLAQIAVGLTHGRRGNGRGAVTLLRRGADAVARYASPASGPGGIDAAAVSRAATLLADRIAAGGLDSVTADDLVLRLTPNEG